VTQTLQYRTAKVLDDAATLIETKGWCRGSYQDGDRHCTVGALAGVSSSDRAAFFVAYRSVLTEIIEITGQSGISISRWNDSQRDRRKVVRTLRRTARKVRRGEIPVQ
jgi:hypothetical protein